MVKREGERETQKQRLVKRMTHPVMTTPHFLKETRTALVLLLHYFVVGKET